MIADRQAEQVVEGRVQRACAPCTPDSPLLQIIQSSAASRSHTPDEGGAPNFIDFAKGTSLDVHYEHIGVGGGWGYIRRRPIIVGRGVGEDGGGNRGRSREGEQLVLRRHPPAGKAPDYDGPTMNIRKLQRNYSGSMRVIVVGATGTIGSVVCDALASHHEVVTVVRAAALELPRGTMP